MRREYFDSDTANLESIDRIKSWKGVFGFMVRWISQV